MQYVLDNRETLIKPLQDRGQKVLIGLMPDHDRVSMDNLADETIAYFSKEVKQFCDAYNLDGVFWDDEWGEPMYPAPIGFTDCDRERACRLLYEVWKQQPDRMNVAFSWESLYLLNPVDGVQPGTYCQYVMSNYFGSDDMSVRYSGLTRRNQGYYSQEFARSYFARDNILQTLKDEGYGCHMIFAMDPYRPNAIRQRQQLESIARIFYADELVVDPTEYKKDW